MPNDQTHSVIRTGRKFWFRVLTNGAYEFVDGGDSKQREAEGWVEFEPAARRRNDYAGHREETRKLWDLVKHNRRLAAIRLEKLREERQTRQEEIDELNEAFQEYKDGSASNRAAYVLEIDKLKSDIERANATIAEYAEEAEKLAKQRDTATKDYNMVRRTNGELGMRHTDLVRRYNDTWRVALLMVSVFFGLGFALGTVVRLWAGV